MPHLDKLCSPNLASTHITSTITAPKLRTSRQRNNTQDAHSSTLPEHRSTDRWSIIPTPFHCSHLDTISQSHTLEHQSTRSTPSRHHLTTADTISLERTPSHWSIAVDTISLQHSAPICDHQ
ncbi:hypothetical protein M758_UG225200 [Ceratodon purpureus]|nr:hypothetical protein M758_UG225200 [Ceratodon purpureus]